MFNPTYLRALAGLFSPPSIRGMAEGRFSRGMDSLIRESGLLDRLPSGSTNERVLDEVYANLRRHYRCEYVYKNLIAKKILLGRHRLADASMATELRCDTSKADFVILNGTSTVYEIKTELDNLDRLPGQIRSYRKMFDRIYVVSHPDLVDGLSGLLEDDIGILALTNRCSLTEKRPSSSHRSAVDPGCIFDSLRKSEFIAIVERHFGAMPKLPNTEHYHYCRALFLKLPAEVAHAEMVSALKSRFTPQITRSFMSQVSEALVAGILGSQLRHEDANSLVRFMKLEYAPP